MANISTKVKAILTPTDYETVVQYLEGKAKSSPGSARTRKSALFRFLAYVQRPTLLEITPQDAMIYFNYLDQCTVTRKNRTNGTVETKLLTKTYKTTQHALIHSFFKHSARNIRRDPCLKMPYYLNPIPDSDEVQFQSNPIITHAQRQRQIDSQEFKIPQLLKILKELYYKAPNSYTKGRHAYFLISVLLTTCGMRISEVVTVKVSDVNLSERFLMTGVEVNARKSNKGGDNPLYFCFPDVVAYLLSGYVKDLRRSGYDGIWLFPGSKGNYVSVRTVQQVFRKIFPDLPVKTHTFRKTFESNHAKNGVPLHFIEVLSNHAISSVVMKHYVQIDIKERRELYDQYFPPQYRPILNWLETL